MNPRSNGGASRAPRTPGSGRIPKLRQHKPTGIAFVEIPGRGKVYLGDHGSPESKVAYREAVVDWLVACDPGPNREVVATTAKGPPTELGPRNRKPPGYRLHKTSDRAYVRLPTQPKAAVVYLGKYGSPESWKEYHRVLQAWLGGEDRGTDGTSGGSAIPPSLPPSPSPPPSVSEIATAFLEWARGYYRKRGDPTSQALTVDLTTREMIAECGGIPAPSFDAQHLKRVRARFVASGLTRNECNRRATVVKQCLGWAVEEGLISVVGWYSCKAVKGLKRDRTSARETAPVRPVPIEVVEACIPHMPRPVVAMVRLQLLTGMRPDEACQVALEMIDGSGEMWVYRPDRQKAEHHGHQRAIPLGPKARDLGSEWADWEEPSKPLFSPSAWMEERAKARRASRKSKVQPTQRDRSKPGAKREFAGRYAETTYRQAVKRAAKVAGQPHWTPHQLRHTYGTQNTDSTRPKSSSATPAPT